jgi:hypothetical protein
MLKWAFRHRAAAHAGAAEVCQFLLSEKSLGCDPNVFDSGSFSVDESFVRLLSHWRPHVVEKHTPLHLACGASPETRKVGHKLVVASLLSHGANPNAEDDGGYTRAYFETFGNSDSASCIS